jgi:hypothetical protein
VASLKLRKGPVWIAGYVSILGIIAAGFLKDKEAVILAALDAFVWLIAIGLGANVLFALQKSAFYRKELDKEEE